MMRYYGYYSNVLRGKRQKEGLDDAIPCIMETQVNKMAFRKNWVRLIMNIKLTGVTTFYENIKLRLQTIYKVDPLVCPKYQGTMQIISFIEGPSLIRLYPTVSP